MAAVANLRMNPDLNYWFTNDIGNWHYTCVIINFLISNIIQPYNFIYNICQTISVGMKHSYNVLYEVGNWIFDDADKNNIVKLFFKVQQSEFMITYFRWKL